LTQLFVEYDPEAKLRAPKYFCMSLIDIVHRAVLLEHLSPWFWCWSRF